MMVDRADQWARSRSVRVLDELEVHAVGVPHEEHASLVGHELGLEVVDRPRDRLAALEAHEVLDEELGLEGLGVVEAELAALLVRELGPISIVVVVLDDRDVLARERLDDVLVRTFCSAAMAEAAAIGARIGCAITQTPDERNAITRKLGAFKTSMLQDVEAGRQIELEALIGAPREIGRRVGVPTPNIDTLYALTSLMAESRRLN